MMDEPRPQNWPYWFEYDRTQEKGECLEGFDCTEGWSLVHRCRRFEGHKGSHAVKVRINNKWVIEKA